MSMCVCFWLVETSLLYDPQKLLSVDCMVAIDFRLFEHLQQLVVRYVLAKLSGHSFEVIKSDLSAVAVVKELKGLHDLLINRLLRHSLGHQADKIRQCDVAVLVVLLADALDLLLFRLKAKLSHGKLQLLRLQLAGLFHVKTPKGRLDVIEKLGVHKRHCRRRGGGVSSFEVPSHRRLLLHLCWCT